MRKENTLGILNKLFGTQSGKSYCYMCKRDGHVREIELVEKIMFDMRKWNKPWNPTQHCFQCGNCGRLTCWTHSDNRKLCECGEKNWIERMYVQKELDNG